MRKPDDAPAEEESRANEPPHEAADAKPPEHQENRKNLVSRQLKIIFGAQERLATTPADSALRQTVGQCVATLKKRRDELRARVQKYADAKESIPREYHWTFRDVFFKEYREILAEIIAEALTLQTEYQRWFEAHPTRGARAKVIEDQLQKIGMAIELLEHREKEAGRRFHRAHKKRTERESAEEPTSESSGVMQRIADLFENAPRADEIGSMPGFESAAEPEPEAAAAPELKKRVYIKPPSFEKLERDIHRATIRQHVIGDIMKMAYQDEAYQERDATDQSVLEDFISVDQKTGSVADAHTGSEISDDAIEGILAYLQEFTETIHRHNPEHTIEEFFGADFFARLQSVKSRLEEVLQKREIKDAQTILAGKSPEEVRAYFLLRYGISGSASGLTQAAYEARLREWLDHEGGEKRNLQDALSLFCIRCAQALDMMKVLESDERLAEKADIIQRTQAALRRVPQMKFPDPENNERVKAALRDLTDEYQRDLAITALSGAENVQDRIDAIRKEKFIASQKSPGALVDEVNQIHYPETGIMSEKVDNGLYSVDTRLIIGSALSRQNWITTDEKAIRDQAGLIHDHPNAANLKQLFFDSSNKERIILWRLHGPAGDVYLVKQGMDAAVAAKSAGIPRVIARIYEIRTGSKSYPFKFTLNNKYDLPRLLLLKELREEKLIDVELDELDFTDIREGRPVTIELAGHALPWLLWFSESIPDICRRYEELYKTKLTEFPRLDGRLISERLRNILTNDLEFQKKFMGKGKGRSFGA